MLATRTHKSQLPVASVPATAHCSGRMPVHRAALANAGPSGRIPSSQALFLPTNKVFCTGHRAVRVQAAESALGADFYVCLGLSQCYEKQEGTLTERNIIEPISASSLECMATGARTSFRYVTGVTLSDAIARDRSLLPAEFRTGLFCDNFRYRLDAAARTWQRPHAQDNLMDIVPLGKVRGNFNFSVEDKRVLNFENAVSDDDNIKQDISIDVYGRQKKEEIAAKLAAEAEKIAETACAAAQEEDDLDALLTA